MLNNIQAYLKSKNIDPNELSQGIQLGGMALNPSQNTTGIGNIAQGAGAALSLVPGAQIAGAALSAAGVLTNTLFGNNVNKSAVQSIQQQNSDMANLQADTSSNQSILDQFNGLQLLDNINKKDIGTEGLFSNKVSNIAKKLNTQRDLANMQAINNLNYGAQTVQKQNDLMALQNYAAYGGNLNNNLFENGGQINHSYKTNSFIRNKIREFEGSSMKTNDSFISQERKFNKITPNLDKLTDNQKHALFSYMYNAPKAYINKTLPLIQQLSDSPSNELYKQIGDSIQQGQNSSLRGLKMRREWERNLFSKDLINQTNNQTNNQNNNETSFINNTINSNQFNASNINEQVAQPLYNNNYISANELLSYVTPTQKSQLQTPQFSSVYNNQYLNNTFSKGGNLNLMKNKSNNKNEKGQSFSELLKDKSNFIRSNAQQSINNKELQYASGGDINRLNGFISTIYADGGYTQNQQQPDYSDLLDRVNKSNADFINRLKDPNRQTIKLAKGRVATHKMSWADDGNGNAIIYPEVQNINGKLVDLSGSRKKAFESAVQNGDTIHMTPSEADWFTNNYKKYYPGFDEYAMGGGLSRSKNYESSKEPYPSVKSKDFAGGGRSYPIPTKADAIDALRLAGMHNRPDVRAKVYRKYPELKHDLGGPLFDYGGNLYTNLPNENQHGGYFDDGLMEINEGGTHEQNPYHGVQLGLNSQGKQNLVEQGETVFDDYVFSNRIQPSKTLLQENLLPTSGSTFASISKSLSRESKERPNDPISNNGLNVSMQRLKNAQEEAKQASDIKDRYLQAISGIYDNSDENINPDQYNIQNPSQEQDQQLEQQEQQEDNQQQYARGGVKSKLKYLDTIPQDSYIVANNYKPNFEQKLKNMNIPIILNKQNQQNQQNPQNTQKFKDNTFLRYAPVLGSLAATFGDMAGITNRPNYSNADAIQSATQNIPNVNFTPIGQRLKYNPMDTNLYMNQAQAQNNASLDAIKENSLGNSSAANAAILANNYNYQNNLGNFGLQAQQYNDKQKQLVTDFNRQTDEFNSEGALKAESANLSKSNLLLDSAFKQAAMKQQIYDNSQNARMANLNNLLQSLGDIGNENEQKNWLNALSQSNVFGTLNPVMQAAMNGKTTFKKGGKLKTIKKKGLLF